MANTYFEINKEVTTKNVAPYEDYTNRYRLSLTAFVGKEENLQLTVSCNSTRSTQSGTGFITLTPEEVDKLIIGLLERRLRISATGIDKSLICPSE